MYVKITNDQPVEFPYTIGQFRRDNPHTSFPKNIPDSMLRRNLVHPVVELGKPNHDPLVQDLVMDEMPHREVLWYRTEEDATDPITGEVDQDQVGEPIHGNRWLIGYTIVNKPQDQAKDAVRDRRNKLLSTTDWMALSDSKITSEWSAYRQALRDISSQSGFPYSVEWPTEPQ